MKVYAPSKYQHHKVYIVYYTLNFIELDEWQKEVLEHEGNIALRAGRQVGKSTVIAIKAARYATRNPGQSIMIISSTERQAYLLFSKVLSYLLEHNKSQIKKGKDRPTKTEIKLVNRSIIRCLPTGLDGLGIRGYTVNLLIADEAAFIPQDVWPAITPMLSTTGGHIILLSTPFGKSGYFYERFNDDDFKKWHINAESVADARPEPQRTYMMNHQAKERERMTTLQYAQEYLGEFVDELRRFFSDEQVRKVCILKRNESIPKGEFYLGVDIARMGDDESTFEIINKINKKEFEHIESIVTKKTLTTQTFDEILYLNRKYSFKKIGIDAGSGSLGVGILDFLIREPEVKRKVIALNNRQRDLDHEGEKKITLLKEDMYLNLLAMMEKGYIKLLDDDEIIASLRSVQYEYIIRGASQNRMKIFGDYTHIVEGLIRSCWLANEKHLNSFISYF